MAPAGRRPAKRMTAIKICDRWSQASGGIDSEHHPAGNSNFRTKEDDQAEVLCYAIASHYKKSATKGNVREFVGSYDVILVLTDVGWKINGFRYNLKYITGNVSLE